MDKQRFDGGRRGIDQPGYPVKAGQHVLFNVAKGKRTFPATRLQTAHLRGDKLKIYDIQTDLDRKDTRRHPRWKDLAQLILKRIRLVQF